MPRQSTNADRTIAAIVTPKYLPLLGGMERECAVLAREFAQRGFSSLIITEQLGLDLPRRESDDGVEVVRVPSGKERTLWVQLRAAAGMTRELLRHRNAIAFAVVRTATLPALTVGLLKALRMLPFPTLVTAETGGEHDDVEALARRPLFPISRALVSSHDVLNGICQANIDHWHEHGFPDRKITFIPNGIDTAAWATTAPPPAIRRFLFLGRIEPLKGIFELAEAIARVRARHPDVRLTVAGEGPSRGEMEQRCSELGIRDSVEFVGRVRHEELGALFASIDCLVLPSYSEGMPLSVLEAAVHHRPMIVTDVGDMRALFGDSVRICPPRDIEALVAALEDAVGDPQPATAYDAVVERVAIATVAEQILARLGIEPQV